MKIKLKLNTKTNEIVGSCKSKWFKRDRRQIVVQAGSKRNILGSIQFILNQLVREEGK